MGTNFLYVTRTKKVEWVGSDDPTSGESLQIFASDFVLATLNAFTPGQGQESTSAYSPYTGFKVMHMQAIGLSISITGEGKGAGSLCVSLGSEVMHMSS